jgi:hypothetical protein
MRLKKTLIKGDYKMIKKTIKIMKTKLDTKIKWNKILSDEIKKIKKQKK